MKATRWAATALLLAACSSAGGADGAGGEKPIQHADEPLLVTIPGATVVSGFAAGRLRKSVDVGSFQITKLPVTRAQYESCSNAGTCDKLEKPTCELPEDGPLARLSFDAPSAPALCVGYANAQAYCTWIGGHLPTLDQWLYAARGRQPQRYSWGDAELGCDRHPRLERIVPPSDNSDDDLVRAEPCTAKEDGKIEVGQHPAGASSQGVEDVLLASAELLRTEPSPLFSACDLRFPACLVAGSTPGSIDSVEPLRAPMQDATADNAAKAETSSPYTFRCAVGGN